MYPFWKVCTIVFPPQSTLSINSSSPGFYSGNSGFVHKLFYLDIYTHKYSWDRIIVPLFLLSLQSQVHFHNRLQTRAALLRMLITAPPPVLYFIPHMLLIVSDFQLNLYTSLDFKFRGFYYFPITQAWTLCLETISNQLQYTLRHTFLLFSLDGSENHVLSTLNTKTFHKPVFPLLCLSV